MKNDGAKTDLKVSDSFGRRLNNLMIDLNKELTDSHFAGRTAYFTLEVNMTQGQINSAYVMPKRKLDIE